MVLQNGNIIWTHGMRIFVDRDGGPLEVKLDEDQDEPCHGEKPGGDHQQAVEHEPLVQLAAVGSGPCLKRFLKKCFQLCGF